MSSNEASSAAPPVNPAAESATLLFQAFPGMAVPFMYGGIKHEIEAYRTTAWIGTSLHGISPVIDVVGPDAVEFLNSICINDFSKLGPHGLRHAVICNEQGQILTDGVAIRVGEDRIRTYWLNPPIQYYLDTTDLDVWGEDMSAQEYFIQIAGERSLEILEDAFQADLHDIKFARHRKETMDGREVEVIRLGMSGNLAYEIHGPIGDFDYVYRKVWASGQKFGARQQGLNTYNAFNHTEAGFPNINLHYPLPWFESDPGLAAYLAERPMTAFYNLNRRLAGSVGDDLQTRFMTPYDVGWDFLVNFNHEFRGKEALQRIAENPTRTAVTLEWNADDIGTVFASMFRPGETPADDISRPSDTKLPESVFGRFNQYHADRVLHEGEDVGITSGRIISYTYNAMISIGFIRPDLAVEGTELTIIWGAPGERQFEVSAKVARFPYNSDLVRNEHRDVSDVPRLQA